MTQSPPRRVAPHLKAVIYLQCMFAASLLLEAGGLYLLLSPPRPAGQQQWLQATALHLLAAAVPLLYRYRPARFPSAGWYLPKLTGLITLFLPVVGISGMFLTVNLTKLLIRPKGLAHEFEQEKMHLTHLDAGTITRTMDDMLREELATQPIVDILLGSDDDLKRGAIMLLKRMKSPRAVTLLKESLSDASAEVRFFAHTALTQLEEDAVERLDKAEELAASGDAALVRAFAEACREYARSGLPEDTMRSYYLAESRKQYLRYMSIERRDHMACVELGHVSLELKDYESALRMFTTALDYPDTRLAGRLGRCWAFFEQRDWVRLSREMAIMRSAMPEADEADEFSRALYVFWAQHTTDGTTAPHALQARTRACDMPGATA
ncbi:HEAT repeat domain-containing protein [Desulfovibrio psychrotolerans]|uniref:HEAT repeat domain-containing protein n=1 Tax=Desulfovibrio psychrotolerans TaxID=415242 RepID=A0A7J0BQB6_9BACT|nr:HEAT repeat domain-containing protein [Desulfovibrio psychrotolerans]GFM35325.1 hypothetical protein DSM19430T_00090 [Desulfovibrio psychrotolerans]